MYLTKKTDKNDIHKSTYVDRLPTCPSFIRDNNTNLSDRVFDPCYVQL